MPRVLPGKKKSQRSCQSTGPRPEGRSSQAQLYVPEHLGQTAGCLTVGSSARRAHAPSVTARGPALPSAPTSPPPEVPLPAQVGPIPCSASALRNPNSPHGPRSPKPHIYAALLTPPRLGCRPAAPNPPPHAPSQQRFPSPRATNAQRRTPEPHGSAAPARSPAAPPRGPTPRRPARTQPSSLARAPPITCRQLRGAAVLLSGHEVSDGSSERLSARRHDAALPRQRPVPLPPCARAAPSAHGTCAQPQRPFLISSPPTPGKGGTPGGGARVGVRRRGRDKSAGRSGRAHVGGAPRGAAAGSRGRDGAVTCAPGEAGRGEGWLWLWGGSGVRSRAVRSQDAGPRGRVRRGAGPAPCRAARAAAADGEPPPWAAAWGGSAGSGPPPGVPAREQVRGTGGRGVSGGGVS